MHRLQALDGCLASMDDLRHTLESGITNEDVLALANTLPVAKLERIKNERLLDNVLRARSVFKPNPYFGTRLAANQQVLIDVDEFGAKDLDLFMTDSAGIPKNRVSDEDTAQRIAHAKEQGKKIISFFGGSTTMGTGSRLPAFTIPSLVEQILSFKYQLDTVCVNRGILGMTSQDSFNMLTADTLRSPPDCVVFYTGWNCVFNQSALHALLKSNNSSQKSDIYLGMSTRHIEHGMQLSGLFNVAQSWSRAFRLTINKLLTQLSRLFGSKPVRKMLNGALKSDPTVNHSFVPEIIDAISKSNANEIAQAAAQDYLLLTRLAHACCVAEGVPFLNFFQPCLSWGNKPTTPLEKEYIANSPAMGGIQQKFKEQVMSHTLPDYFHDLSGIFDQVPRQVYVDTGHLNPYGNFIVAEKITDQLAAKLN